MYANRHRIDRRARDVASLSAVVLLALSSFAPADEALLPDGKRVAGNVEFTDKGRLRFRTANRSLLLDEVHQLRFTIPEPPPPRVSVLHRVELRDGQHLTGAIVELTGESLRCRVPWYDQVLTLPRWAVRAVTQPPGYATFFDDDFEADEPKAWKLTDTPRLERDGERTSGRQSLALGQAGQVAEFSLGKPLSAGRVAINFLDPGPTPGARWFVDTEYEGAALQIGVAGPGQEYLLRVPGGGKVEPKRLRERGWHRLMVEFSSSRLRVFVDQYLLRESPAGPGGPLTKVRLRCVAAADGKGATAKVCFDDFSLARAVRTPQRETGDLTQDELCLFPGDQLFGEVLHADRRTMELQGRFGRRSFSWGDVHAIYFKQQAGAGRPTGGEHVRIWLHPGTGAALDELHGVLKSLDSKRLTLIHPALGELSVDRARLQQLQGTFHGRRIELDPCLHHLGKKHLPGLLIPAPEGLALRARFTLPAVFGDARLVVDAAHLKGPPDGDKMATTLAAGGLRTEVLVNGMVIDYLNHHAGKASPDLRRLTITLPKARLRAGENVVELRQTAERATGRYEDCIVGGLVVEIP